MQKRQIVQSYGRHKKRVIVSDVWLSEERRHVFSSSSDNSKHSLFHSSNSSGDLGEDDDNDSYRHAPEKKNTVFPAKAARKNKPKSVANKENVDCGCKKGAKGSRAKLQQQNQILAISSSSDTSVLSTQKKNKPRALRDRNKQVDYNDSINTRKQLKGNERNTAKRKNPARNCVANNAKESSINFSDFDNYSLIISDSPVDTKPRDTLKVIETSTPLTRRTTSPTSPLKNMKVTNISHIEEVPSPIPEAMVTPESEHSCSVFNTPSVLSSDGSNLNIESSFDDWKLHAQPVIRLQQQISVKDRLLSQVLSRSNMSRALHNSHEDYDMSASLFSSPIRTRTNRQQAMAQVAECNGIQSQGHVSDSCSEVTGFDDLELDEYSLEETDLTDESSDEDASNTSSGDETSSIADGSSEETADLSDIHEDGEEILQEDSQLDSDMSHDESVYVSANSHMDNGNHSESDIHPDNQHDAPDDIHSSLKLSVDHLERSCTPPRKRYSLHNKQLQDLQHSFSEMLTPVRRKGSLVPLSAQARVLVLCDQTEPISFKTAMTSKMLNQCKKIGEGVYGEVFRSINSAGQSVAIKIIPIEGDFPVNDEAQKTFAEITPEIVIAKELSGLRCAESCTASSFCQVITVSCVQGQYPPQLLKQWDIFHKTKTSENDRPDMFGKNQLYIVFEFADCGSDLESYKFEDLKQGKSVLVQVAYALAVAEEALQFEHRDLHWGNVLVRPTNKTEISFRLMGNTVNVPSMGVEASVIDFTMSRLTKDGCIVYTNLSEDDTLFEGKGDYQFDVYRDMKKYNGGNWEKFSAHTNVLWLHYLTDKLVYSTSYPGSLRKHRNTLRQFRQFMSQMLKYHSTLEMVVDSTFLNT